MTYESKRWIYHTGVPHFVIYTNRRICEIVAYNSWEPYEVYESEIDSFIPDDQIPTFIVDERVMTDKGDIVTIKYVNENDHHKPYRTSNGFWYTPFNLTKIDY